MCRNLGVTILLLWLNIIKVHSENICAFSDKSYRATGLVNEDDTDNAVKYSDGAGMSGDKSLYGGEILPDNKTIRCVEEKTYCFTLWSTDANNKSQISVIKQGCWIGGAVCTSNNCLSDTAPKPIPTTNSSQQSKFCCCTGHLCNENMTDIYIPSLHTTAIPVIPEFDQHYRERTIIISLVSVCSVAVVTVIVYFLYRVLVTSKRVSMDSLNIMESAPPPNFTLEDLKLSAVVNRGRYSEVWKGLLNDQEVAVKIYAANYKQHFTNERNIYSLPFLEHESLLQFYGSDERLSQDGIVQYMLILTYIPTGSLFSYLKHNTVDWSTLCKMCISFTRGLAHLHNDITKGDQFKPAVAHRDFNSRNILVRSDLSCIVADLGFSMSAMGSKLIRNGHAENAEQTSLTDVGTLRYMAPELLDGAVNLRDCEASLKQIDIYALGLVLWEVATRCIDLYQGAPVPDYMLPYQAEAGIHPTFEQLQLLVCRNKTRPKFSEIWKDTNQAVRSLRETMDDCWDADADARLTVLCVEERLSDMIMMWAQDSKHRGMTPTINQTIHQLEKQTVNCLPNHTINEADTQSSENQINSPPDSIIPLMSHIDRNDLSNSSHNYNWYQDMSGSTTESVIPITPVESDNTPKPPAPPLKTNNITQARNSAAMKPNQGRNQVVARNTHKRSDEELAVSGNRLVNNGVGESSDDTTSLQENLFESVGDNLETSLVQNDVLNQHRNPPIPYVQNQVHGEPISARPKVANLPGNGISNFQKSGDGKSFREKLGKFIKPQVIGLKLSQFNLFGKNYKVNKGETSSNFRPQTNHNVLVDETSPLNPPEENHSNLHRQTEVYLQNGQTHTRPTNLALQVMGNQCTTDHDNIPPSYIENRLGFAEVGVAKLHQSNDPQSSVLRVKNGVQSKSTSDLSPAKKSKLQETVIGNSADGQSRRPTSLSLKDSLESPVNSDGDTIRRSAPNMVHKDHKNTTNSSTNSSDKIKRRVKTPVLVNKSRFSLYDDRLMFQSDIVQNNSCVKQLPKTSTSFHQLKTFTSSEQNSTDNTNLVII